MIPSSTRRIYFETQLVPTPGRCDIAVMDNLGSRKTEAARGGPRRRRPPAVSSSLHDPDLIEQASAKLKHFLRKDRPRTRNDL